MGIFSFFRRKKEFEKAPVITDGAEVNKPIQNGSGAFAVEEQNFLDATVDDDDEFYASPLVNDPDFPEHDIDDFDDLDDFDGMF